MQAKRHFNKPFGPSFIIPVYPIALGILPDQVAVVSGAKFEAAIPSGTKMRSWTNASHFCSASFSTK